MTQPVRKPMGFTAGKSFFRGLVPLLNDGREILIGGRDAADVACIREAAILLPAREAAARRYIPAPTPCTWQACSLQKEAQGQSLKVWP